MANVEVKEIRKTFGENTKVLEGINFRVQDGEFISLLGPSGCGKTTLLRIIAGLEFASSGGIQIGDKDVAHLSPKDRDISMVFQNYALYPHLLVEENIAMGLRLRKYPEPEIQTRVSEAAKMLDLEPLLKRKPAELSGGQRQRVALARALVRRPKVYLLDEPLSNLDAVLRDRTRGELKLLFKRVKGTAIYVTHDQVEAMTLSDRIVVMHKGRIQQIGTPDEIYHKPQNTFVAKFLGAPPMNVLALSKAEAAKLVEPAPGRAADRVLCGVRPEDIEFSASLKSGFTPAKVHLAEPTGAHTILTLEVGGLSLRAVWSMPWDTRNPLTEVWFRLPPAKLHFYDGATEERITA
jgi:multiple sugar transport system ATP-binding protein